MEMDGKPKKMHNMLFATRGGNIFRRGLGAAEW